MDIESPDVGIKTPQVKKISLDKIPRRKKVSIPLQIPEKGAPKTERVFIRIVTFIFLLAFSAELLIVYRYSQINRRLYNSLLREKRHAGYLQSSLDRARKVNHHILESRQRVLKGYREKADLLISRERRIEMLSSIKDKLILQIDKIRNLLQDKGRYISLLKGELSVRKTRIGALIAQYKYVRQELERRNKMVQDLTKRFVKNLSEQERLVSENMRLRKELSSLTDKVVDSSRGGRDDSGRKRGR